MQLLLLLLLLAHAHAVVPTASAGCEFCTETHTHGSFDLSSVPTSVFTLHSGTRGSLLDPWLTYYATSPCGSVGSEPHGMCFGGPTSDPVAQHYIGTTPDGRYGVAPICTGLGSLGAALPPAVVYAPATAGVAATLNITLHGGSTEWCESNCESAAGRVMGTCDGNASVTYAMVCDTTVPPSNPPDRLVVVDQHCNFTVSWRHPSVCTAAAGAGAGTRAGAATTAAPDSAARQPGCTSRQPPPAPPPAVCEGCLPPWRPTWNMSRSTILYTCNASGLHNISEAVRYGVVSYDWSNAKALWANAQPMDADDMLTKQAELVMAADPGIAGEQPRVWLYRNKIKGLNWFGSVREKLDDPQYAGWFVKFKSYKGPGSNASYHVPACDWFGNTSHPPKCSGFYHDQAQTPEHPGANQSVYKADGVCAIQCNCGPTNPCAEYTFDHRNASFSEWFVNGYMINDKTLLHNPPINIGWLDDEMSLQGMSEGAPYPTFVADTGSTAEAMQDHVDAFRRNIAMLQKATVQHGGFYWQMITGRGPLIRNSIVERGKQLYNVTAAQCSATLREHYCVAVPDAWRSAHLYEVWPTDPNIGEQATAEFLLTRGEFAWLGYSWSGCKATGAFPRPAEWDVDYGGKPSAPCTETGFSTGIFRREYPKATVQWNCHLGKGEVTMK